LYVLIGHARWLLWEGFAAGFMKHPAQYPLLSKLMAFFALTFNYGHQAVIFFFVLSGFVIHLRYSQALEQDPQKARLNVWQFYFRRFHRIYPLMVTAIVFTLILDGIGMSQGYSIYRQQTM